MQCSACDFIVYTPEKTAIERYEFQPNYVEEFLLPRIQRFYFGKFLPRFVAKQRGLLLHNAEYHDNVIVEPVRYRGLPFYTRQPTGLPSAS